MTGLFGTRSTPASTAAEVSRTRSTGLSAWRRPKEVPRTATYVVRAEVSEGGRGGSARLLVAWRRALLHMDRWEACEGAERLPATVRLFCRATGLATTP
jgi:hypothetical protein